MEPLARVSTSRCADLYPPTHWALRGTPPAFDTPDEDVYLTGRNVVLLSKAGIYCAQQRITRIALGPLAGNPFPDATPGVLRRDGRALSLGLAHAVDDRHAVRRACTRARSFGWASSSACRSS